VCNASASFVSAESSPLRERALTRRNGWAIDPMSMTQPEFARFVLSESESAARIIEAAGIKPQ
jgi:hypothetical protein